MFDLVCSSIPAIGATAVPLLEAQLLRWAIAVSSGDFLAILVTSDAAIYITVVLDGVTLLD